MKTLTLTIAALTLPMLASCEHFTTLRPDRAYVEADRATYELVSPIVRDLADGDPANDPDLSGVNGVALTQALDSWELRIEAAEAEVDE